VHREFSGVMSKPWRMVTLNVGAWITLVIVISGRSPHLGPLTVFDWTCLLVVIGCVQTITIRLQRIFASLAAN
jgi:hypothetical protein